MKENGKWFYTGHMMSDGKTPRTVYIEGDKNIENSIELGMKPVEEKKVKAKKTVKPKKEKKI